LHLWRRQQHLPCWGWDHIRFTEEEKKPELTDCPPPKAAGKNPAKNLARAGREEKGDILCQLLLWITGS